jgi:hypothetical protein
MAHSDATGPLETLTAECHLVTDHLEAVVRATCSHYKRRCLARVQALDELELILINPPYPHRDSSGSSPKEAVPSAQSIRPGSSIQNVGQI